ncbi:MAG: FAD-dependent oxidoreductase, partial [Pseudomonadota bacterium]
DSHGVLDALRRQLDEKRITIRFGQHVTAVDAKAQAVFCNTDRHRFGFLFNCAGAHADRLARMMGMAKDYVLVPFKGIYYKLRPERDNLVRASIYPAPDLNVPFLGVHFTRVASGDVYVGPTAIPALGRENYGILSGLHFPEAGRIMWELGKLYLRNGPAFRHMVHAELGKYGKNRFLKAARRLIPEVEEKDLLSTSKVGIRPQLVNSRQGRLEMDFVVEKNPVSVHVLNAISPAFTSAFAFSEYVVGQAGL